MRRIEVDTKILLDEVARLVATGHTPVIRVRGESMRPFLHGDRDKVRLVPPDNLQRWDIVLACIDGTYVMHRIIRMEGDSITLMGDGNLYGTERCHRQDIVARAVLRIREDRQSEFSRRWGHVWGILRPIRRYLLFIWKRCTWRPTFTGSKEQAE